MMTGFYPARSAGLALIRLYWCKRKAPEVFTIGGYNSWRGPTLARKDYHWPEELTQSIVEYNGKMNKTMFQSVMYV